MMNLAGTERTRLFVEGVGAAITADVQGRRRDGLVVTQALPFLRIDTPVVEGGARARIARVAIAMEGDVPRLLLELSRDDERDDVPPAVVADDTLRGFTPGVSTRPARTDSTVPYDFQARELPRDEPAVTAPREEVIVEPPASWWTRLARRLSMLFAQWTRRAMPALPRG